jgi:hypothetical protein|tara:strand:+ start:2219 stop:2509 length:291 start_codon:yes stop_codon:yes gene_type:complete
MTDIKTATSRTHINETNTKMADSCTGQQQSQSPNFFTGMLASLRRANLGRFFGVTPPVTRGRIEDLDRPDPSGDSDNEETQQAKDIYQAMLDITGH